MSLTPVNPAGLARPVGYSHGMRGRGELLFVAGQVGWDQAGRMVSDDLLAQFDQALANVLAVVQEAGGGPESIARMTLYVTDKDEYVRLRREIGAAYRRRMGKHFPAMALIEIQALLEEGGKIEIEATALL